MTTSTATTAAAAEALVAGIPSWSDVQQLVRKALRARALADEAGGYYWVWIVDITATHVVYELDEDRLFQCEYTVTGGAVTLGEPVQVARTYVATMADAVGDDVLAAAVENARPGERDHLFGRVLEAKGADTGGGRIFRVRIVAVGDSLNGNRYTEAVLAAAAPMYEGAKAYDRHRSPAELQSGTIAGLVGTYRGVEASADGIDADLHLLPGATHAAEVLDAALAAQAAGVTPTAGISHDVLGTFRPLTENGRQLREATAITHVFSADVVSDPSAGGQAVRVVAGGIHLDLTPPAPVAPHTVQETDMQLTAAAILAALGTATPDQLAAAGLTRAGENVEAAPAATAATPAALAGPETIVRESLMGRTIIRGMVQEAGLPVDLIEATTAALPDRFTEADVTAYLAGVKNIAALIERQGLAPQFGGAAGAAVTQEAFDKRRQALDDFFTPNKPGGYRSFTEAYLDVTGDQPRAFGGDLSRKILRETKAAEFDSAIHTTEALDTTSWPQVLGDSITRRAVAEYNTPELQTWRHIVSSTPTVTDFRDQKIGRVGGYGTLPTVAQGGTYQPLTSPQDEEANYAVNKKGGVEGITWEMIRNDDVRRISQIPTKMGRAAAQTLYRFVWDLLPTNAATTYDGVALFHASHANTLSAALSQSSLSTARQQMRVQSAYNDSSEILSFTPKFLVVPASLEEIAFQLCTSAVAVPSTAAGPSDTPNINSAQGLTPILVPYYSDQNDWYVIADPNSCPTIEVGFLDGRQDPEFFTASDGTQGAAFAADTWEIKIRHVYNGVVLDHRGMQRGVA